jgi:ketosteroid isomerase-like protein
MKLFLLSLVTLAWLLVGTSNYAADSNETAIRAVVDAQQSAWNRGDIPAFMQGYVKSDTLRFASGGKVLTGWQATFDRYKTKYPDHAAMGKLLFSDLDVQVLSGDAAFVFGRWKLERKDDSPGGLFTLLFRKTADGWKIVHDHTSSGAE